MNVNGDELKPHLEAMMWEVFKKIQAREKEKISNKLLLETETIPATKEIPKEIPKRKLDI